MKVQIWKLIGVGVVALVAAACSSAASAPPPWEADNPIVAIPQAPLGAEIDLASLTEPPTPDRVRLGRWLFYDKRLSADNSVACATCHRPEHAFSEPTPVSTGIGGQKGRRKAPSFINQADALLPHFFWDGRAGSLEDQALGPIANPIEMGMTDMPHAIGDKISKIQGYKPYFRTRSAATRSRVSASPRRSSTTSDAHERQLGVGSLAIRPRREGGVRSGEAGARAVLREGEVPPVSRRQQFHRQQVPQPWHRLGSGGEAVQRRGSLRGHEERGRPRRVQDADAARRDEASAVSCTTGPRATLREVVELYNRGGNKNPYLDVKMEPLRLSPAEVDAIVAFLESLEGEGYQDKAPAAFPQ